jgi:hypothetical protein
MTARTGEQRADFARSRARDDFAFAFHEEVLPMEDPSEEKKRRRRERFKQRYADEPEFRAKYLAKAGARHQRKKAEINARRRHRYATDPEYRADVRASNAKAQRKKSLKRKYGLSLEGYAAMLARQSGVCAICREKEVNKPLVVDHDHNTRKLRDLLCDPCNLGLGRYNDDPALLRRGADYVEYWQRRHADPGNTDSPSFAACNQQGSFAPSLPSIQSPPLTGEDMTTTDDTTEEIAKPAAAALLKARRASR